MERTVEQSWRSPHVEEVLGHSGHAHRAVPVWMLLWSTSVEHYTLLVGALSNQTEGGCTTGFFQQDVWFLDRIWRL